MKENQTYYLYVKGQKVEVSEEIYRAYVQPERKQKMREYRAKNRIHVSSIEALQANGFEIADDAQDFVDALTEDEESSEEIFTLHSAIGQLSERDRRIVQLYFYESKTQQEIAEAFNVSRQYISKKIKQILEKLKNFF